MGYISFFTKDMYKRIFLSRRNTLLCSSQVQYRDGN